MSGKLKLLFVDDDQAIRSIFSRALKNEPIDIKTASNGMQALEKSEAFSPDVVITDVKMPGMDGLDLLKKIKRRYPDIFVVVVTGAGSVEDAVAAMKLGAYDYLLKPFDFDLIKILIQKIADHKHLLSHREVGGTRRPEDCLFENIIGRNSKMLRVFHKVMNVARTDATVLITGESGTGKELIAEAIHCNSARKKGPLVAVNCAAFTDSLINSELFGHEKGAFTGAVDFKKGHFELSHRGTIFLDEIADLSIPTQVSILRILELGSFYRVGGRTLIKADVRFICATNRNLEEMVDQNIFREDLYHRINVVNIDLPPLRERKSDIPMLVDYFLEKFADESGIPVRRFSLGALELFMKHDWPGNVRELSNRVRSALIFSTGKKITSKDLPQDLVGSISKGDFSMKLSSTSLPVAEATLIKKVLEDSNWNLKQTAGELQIARGTLYSKMKKYGIEKPDR